MRRGAGAGTGQQQQMEEIRVAAAALKLNLLELATELDADSLDRTFKAAQGHVNAIIPTAGRQTFAARKINCPACNQISISRDLPGARVC